MLNDIGKFQLVEYMKSCTITDNGEIDYDISYEAAQTVIDCLFEYCDVKYYENKGLDLIVLSDQVVVSFYLLAGAYGKRSGIGDDANPYILDAEHEAKKWLDFSYSLSWNLVGHTEPRRPFHSRLALCTYYDEGVDIIGLAIGVTAMYRFFSQKCTELRELLSGTEVAAA